MQVCIVGTGYVGLVTGTCLAETGAQVTCVDIDQGKIEGLKKGVIPIFEPGLDELVESNIEAGRLNFTTDLGEAMKGASVAFIAVGTPPDEDGSADLRHVLGVARGIGEVISDYCVVVTKSTVPVGTAAKVREALQSSLDARGESIDFDVASNPEFLKEGAAIKDFMYPDRIVIGTDNERAEQLLRKLYAPYNRNHEKIIHMDIASSELTKYAANAMLAARISLMNEMANIAEGVGADIDQVRRGIGSDPRIGYHFIYPGVGYGGSCFPKDVRALARSARECGHTPRLLDAVEEVNEAQKQRLLQKIVGHFGEDLSGLHFGLWGLAFKPNTDDMREAPSLVLIEALLAAGARVTAHDPGALERATELLAEREGVVLSEKAMDCVDQADALILVTEWKSFWAPDFGRIRERLRQPVLFDGRNVWNRAELQGQGFTYYGIGR